MSSSWPKTGPNFTPAYQISGVPYVTSSLTDELLPPNNAGASEVVRVQFPYVTRAFTIKNTGISPVRVGFSDLGIISPGERTTATHGGAAKDTSLGRNYFIIHASGSTSLSQGASLNHVHRFDLRCKEIYLMAHLEGGKNHSSLTSNDKSGFTLTAELTTIASGEFPTLTGSNGFDGIG
jgi:hypothetical protein